MTDATMPTEIPSPSRVMLASNADFAAQLDVLISKTTRCLRIFDFNAAGCGLNRPAREEQLAALLRGGRNGGAPGSPRLMIVVHDTRYLAREAPRLQRLLGLFSHLMAIHETNEEIRKVEDCLIVGDDAHCIRRPHWERAHGFALFDDPVGTRDWLLRFSEVWEASHLGLSATTLGL